MFYWRTDHRYSGIGVVIFFGIMLTSCHSENPPAAFYPIDSLVSGQIQYLSRINAGLFKEASLSGKTDTITYTPGDTLTWMKELDIFAKLSIINKPINKGSYLVNDGLFDPRSNLTVKAFTSLKELPVVYLKIYYQGNIRKPRKIEALYDETNLLYGSARELSMHFQQIENKTVLTSYVIKGGQKMVFGDSVAFYISAKILID
jgi:hypothetical protein